MPVEVAEATLASSSLVIAGPYKSAKAVPVHCRMCDANFDASVSAFKNRGKAQCKYCEGSRLSESEVIRRLAASQFTVVRDFPTRSTDVFQALCKDCNQISDKTVTSITSGKGCRFCAPNATIDPQEAFSLFMSRGLHPQGDFPGANTGWPSICETCGEMPAPTYGSLTTFKDRGCEFCSGKAVNPERAAEKMKEFGFTPLVPYPGSLIPWLCRCETCKMEPTPSYSGVINGKRCGYCFPGGVDYKLPGILYLISSEEKSAFKIGIQTYSSNRLQTHIRNGWSIQKLWVARTGELAHSIEQSVKAQLRFEFGAKTSLRSSEMPVGGHTETFLTAEIDLQQILASIDNFDRIGGSQLEVLAAVDYLDKLFNRTIEEKFNLK